MYSQSEIQGFIRNLNQGISMLFPKENIEIILFGSYARNEATSDSDLDVLILVDSPRNVIADKNWQIGELAAEILLEYGVVVSPIVENREFFIRNLAVLPFFQVINKEGVRINA